MKVGIDRTWYPVDFKEQTSYINGFAEDLLIEISHYSGLQFELINANTDNLLSNLKEKKFDAVLTSLPPYEYNRAKFDFSESFLDFGPVLIVPVGSKKDDLRQFDDELVGIISNDPAARILEKYPKVVIRSYDSIPDLLNALIKGEIDGAMLDRIPAVNYVSNLYANVLEIVGKPMSDVGLRLVGTKGEIRAFNKSLEALKRKNTIEKLLKKWDLA